MPFILWRGIPGSNQLFVILSFACYIRLEGPSRFRILHGTRGHAMQSFADSAQNFNGNYGGGGGKHGFIALSLLQCRPATLDPVRLEHP